MNTIQQYLQDYLELRKSDDFDAYDKLFAQYKELLDKSQQNEKECFKFLPENQSLSFHDATIEGNVKPNIGSNSFDLTIRMLCYQKIEDTSVKYPYQEVDPVYVRFTLDDKNRSAFHKLAVKCSAILAVAYENNNLGIVYLDNDWKTRAFYQEGVDLSNCKPVEHKPTKKMKM
jgi:hypothetical protein